jgi:alpha-maltose-1-phosphate synthase
MRIAILTSGRFWMCDLARELNALGHDVRLYSLVPPWRTRHFGVPRQCNRWLAPYLAPIIAATRLGRGSKFENNIRKTLAISLDKIVSKLIEPCDLFIGMAGMCLYTIETVRKKYKAKIFLERGSRHILSQKAILESISSDFKLKQPVPDWIVNRELAEYQLADTIVVPSMHVAKSFIEYGVKESILFRNTFGVDLSMFPTTPPLPLNVPPQIIMTGTWSLRKGCDILLKSWRNLKGVKLLHIGDVDDLPLPNDPNFEHQAPVSQNQLTKVYAKGHVFALASREEGLALVQPQALASGLQLVCTDRTGGEDLREFLEDPNHVSVVPAEDPSSLTNALKIALERAKSIETRDLLGQSRINLSWQSYGRRYNQALVERV